MNESENSENLKTNVKGYFNPNTYSISLAISECNLSIKLDPMQFILDRRTGKKINDPRLDRYVGKMLRPEIVDKPIDVLRLPVLAPLPPSESGYVVGQGTKDATGKWIPPQMASAPPQQLGTSASGAPLVSARSCVAGMTIEEARRRGLIGKPRLVPEDFGAAETEGAPVEGARIPRIRYSMESKPKLAAAQPGATPAEWREGIDPKVAPILQSLEAAAAQDDPEHVDLSERAAEKAVRAQQGAEGVRQFKQQAKTFKAQAAPVAPPVPQPAPAPPVQPPAPKRKRIAQVMTPSQPPEHALVVATPGPVAESPIMAGRPDDMPQPDLEEEGSGPITEADRGALPVVCGACGKGFRYESWYARHVRQVHRDRLTEMLPHAKP